MPATRPAGRPSTEASQPADPEPGVMRFCHNPPNPTHPKKPASVGTNPAFLLHSYYVDADDSALTFRASNIGQVGWQRMASTVTIESRTDRLLSAETIGTSAMVYLIVTVLHRGLSFVRAAFFASRLTPTQLGLWDMTFGFGLLMAPIVVLGLPACLARYAPHYQEKGQLAGFLTRIVRLSLTVGLGLALVFGLADRMLATVIYGDPAQTELARLAALCLAGLLMFDIMQSVFQGLRLFRLVSLFHLLLNVSFAGLGALMLLSVAPTAQSVALAHIISTFAVVFGVVWWLRKRLPGGDPVAMTESKVVFWRRMATYTTWIWVFNGLMSLLVYVDRLMLIHCSGQPHDVSLAWLGSYHVFRLVGMLVLTVGAVFSSVLVPHMGHYWESGQRDRVRLLLGAIAKGVALALTGMAVVLLLVHEPVLDLLFAGKYGGGPDLMAAVLVFTAMMGMYSMIDPYVLCLEKPWLSAVSAMVAITANVALNVVLIPAYGLLGAATATALSMTVGTAVLMILCRRYGWRFDRGLVVLVALPLTLFLGPLVAAGAYLTAGLMLFRNGWLVTAEERELVVEQIRTLWNRLQRGESR